MLLNFLGVRSDSKASVAGADEFWEGLSDIAYLSKLGLGDNNAPKSTYSCPHIFSFSLS